MIVQHFINFKTQRMFQIFLLHLLFISAMGDLYFELNFTEGTVELENQILIAYFWNIGSPNAFSSRTVNAHFSRKMGASTMPFLA